MERSRDKANLIWLLRRYFVIPGLTRDPPSFDFGWDRCARFAKNRVGISVPAFQSIGAQKE
jgi:hypothetical protein